MPFFYAFCLTSRTCLVQLLCKTIPIQDETTMVVRPILYILIFLDSQYASSNRFSLFSRCGLAGLPVNGTSTVPTVLLRRRRP